jgi:hypothetical protein
MKRLTSFAFLRFLTLRHGWRCKNALAGVFAKQKLQSLLLAWMLITMTGASTENVMVKIPYDREG